MSYQVLARKYRPQRFSDVIGQEHVTRTLKNALEQGRVAHGYIFSGHRGIGKTTVARILAMALNCRSSQKPVPEPCGKCESCTEIRMGNAVDVIEVDAATNRGIDEIRELREAARYRPARDRYKIYILDEAHQITDAAFNALLKTLEEPPDHIVFMMATTQPEDIPQTIRSRCQHFSFHAVRFEDIVGQLRQIAKEEQIQGDDDALALLAEAGDGSMRDALSIMDQAIASSGNTLSAELVRGLVGTVPSEVLEKTLEAVEHNSSEEVLRLVDKLMMEGQNPVHFARQLVRFVRNAMVAKVAGRDSSLLQISQDERERVSRVAALFGEEDLTRFLNILLRTHNELGYKQEQRFHLELGLLKLVHAQRLLPVEELLSEAAAGTAASSARPATSSTPPRAATVPAPPAQRTERVSPFQADVARKGSTPRSEMSVTPIAMGVSTEATARVLETPAPRPVTEMEIAEKAPAAEEAASVGVSEETLRTAVLSALEKANRRALLGILETAEWKLTGGELEIKAAVPAVVLDLEMNTDTKRMAQQAAGAAAGRPIKIKVVAGAVSEAARAKPRPVSGGGSARSRAANDPVVRRMQEKFGAEIRTVIDHREKK